MFGRLRGLFTRLFTPIAAFLLRIGVTPDMVTIAGTLGVVVSSLVLFPTGHLFWGTMAIMVFAFSDVLDGNMARQRGITGPWGGFLDSTLDRVADGAVFAGLLAYLWTQDEVWGMGFALACLVLGGVVPYARAKAESLGMTATVGIAERADRLVLTLVAAGLVGLGVPDVVLVVVLGLLALASAITVVQRMATVHRQAQALTSGPAE
ncbi:CDP-diacylglycerol inositol 3-phosphatidyltransferase [Sediminihabitans luteus]|uniref:Phosphatidylinositol phosphate synthase n=1 Tax=Sediminihabitans luteus TaxID=1138585 RepID=A0A2M9CQG3_9CELL|nr:CDP-alcohol phosphatidyltransferase family protein [Sediminihabitans luteus]PJJ74144.1 CDP-diacylglycerol inositol 3-phosphatidyltransferase [Sediminihabitans luteus]GII98997.1 CDP-alcohol phosphatidyltransferase [Sediminihabitans luteus]